MNDHYESVSGWGRTKCARVTRLQPRGIDQLQELISQALPQSLIARGLGRSYGDAAQLDGFSILDLKCFNKIALDVVQGYVTAGAGVSLEKLLQVLVPQGFFLPVTPGTRNVTVGGAIAADVHGKNHHVDGSFGSHLTRLLLVDGNGELRELTPNRQENSGKVDQFWATVGGMGLTGVIVEATFSLIPISNALISVDTHRFSDLDALMSAMVEADRKHRYSVAWVDSLNRFGRGVLTNGDHAELDQLSTYQKKSPLSYNPKAIAKTPSFLPNGLLNKLTVSAFNEAWYRKAPRDLEGELQEIGPYFHPLDGVQDWNRIYGSTGFVQYQFAVPDKAANLVPYTLEVLKEASAYGFLTVLKRFGEANPGLLSFPMSGWTLAVDIPARVPGIWDVLDKLDDKVASVGGRLYLAKDSRQSATMFARTYPLKDDWKKLKSELDPRFVFSSDICKRLELFI